MDRRRRDRHSVAGEVSRHRSPHCPLHKYVIELAGFADDPAKSNESRLEAIQMAWHEEFQDAQG